MSYYQIASLVVLTVVAAWVYGPAIKLPRGSSLLKQIAAVVNIRDTATAPNVVSACNQLLAALLEVSK